MITATDKPMPYFAEGSVAMLTLEGMVDAVGLRNVLYALSHICDAKAVHIATDWQDSATAKDWAKAAVMLDKAAQHNASLVVSP